jgi:undecaprenyl pyrophosphate phosphatase UppP
MFLFLWILIQIIGESLPISSSGHVLLMQKLFAQALGKQATIIDFLLHGPTILILLIYFFKTWWQMILPGLSLNDYCFNFWILDRGRGRQEKDEKIDQNKNEDGMQKSSGPSGVVQSYASCPPGVAQGYASRPRENEDPGNQIKSFSFIAPFCFTIIADLITFLFWILNLSKFSIMQTYFLPIGFCITIYSLYFSYFSKGDKPVAWSVTDAIILGTAQGLSLLPGISRFAFTYFVGTRLGYNRQNSFALSFLIQMPLLCAAFAKGVFAIRFHPEIVTMFMSWPVIFSILFASVIGYTLFCWVARLIDQNRLWYFTGYMIIPLCLSLWIVKDVWL